MNVYHKVLCRLYEATEGKDSQAVDFKELVKELGFLGNYPDIFKQMSRQGWIAESRRADVVNITHWGIKEAKKANSGISEQSDAFKMLDKEVVGLRSNLREFSILLDAFSAEKTKESFADLEKKFKELLRTVDTIKEIVE